MIHIATDEAGYGPTLGPLVITATAWQSSGQGDPDAWYDLFRPEVVASCSPRGRCGQGLAERKSSLVVTDSKKLYHSGGGRDRLERAALSLIAVTQGRTKTWREMLRRLDPEVLPRLEKIPWFRDYDCPLPAYCPVDEIESGLQQLTAALGKAGIQSLGVRSRFVPAVIFNELLRSFDSKASLLSHLTLQLALAVCPNLGNSQDMTLWADKHGGRSHYTPLLRESFGFSLVQVVAESSARSEYLACRAGASCRFVFLAKAESLFPVAAASVVSKYLRELAMQAFNEYWHQHIPGITPTAGYPQDAARFLREIADVQQKLQISDEIIRRQK